MKTYKSFSTRQTPQSELVYGKKMIKNSAEGYIFEITNWERLKRFLILGTDGGTYYASEKELTRKNAECVIRCINEDGSRTVNTILEISNSGRAPKNDPALFALALCASFGNNETKREAFKALPSIARIGTHLFHFVSYIEQFRGWGRSLSNAIKQWYQTKSVDTLVYQVLKYQNRDGWSHRDLLRLSHPKPIDNTYNAIYRYITKKEVSESTPELIKIFEKAKSITNNKEKVKLINNFSLTREMIPTEWLREACVWEALLENMPMTAMIRNLATMTKVGLLVPMNNATNKVINALTNIETLQKARIHPLALLSALNVYQAGYGVKGQGQWVPVMQIVDALNDAFYKAFNFVESSNKRIMIGLDVSASMTRGSIAGIPGLNPRVASAALSLVTAAVEEKYSIMAFCHEFVPLDISPKQRLDDILKKIDNLEWGDTDCALPILYADKYNIPVDIFIIYTDNETWAGKIHPFQALQLYRRKTGIPAKLVVVGMTATDFSIADPNDFGMMDVVGFDTVAPQLITDFAKS